MKELRVLFRADASVRMGTGHIMRCGTLADALREHGHAVDFACRPLEGNLIEWLKNRGYPVHVLEAAGDEPMELPKIPGAEHWDWLVVDHYDLDSRWELAVKQHAGRLMVIDDLADRVHVGDLLLDQNYFHNPAERYRGKVPQECRLLLGPQYALLRPGFAEAHLMAQKRATVTVHRILVFFGGSDPANETEKAIDALSGLNLAGIHIDVVVGSSNPRRDHIERLCQTLASATFHCQVDYMPRLMLEADLSIGAGGTTTWERFCVGLPGLVIAVADNQTGFSRELAEDGYQVYLGSSAEVSRGMLESAVRMLMENAELRDRLSRKGLDLVDGQGAMRVAAMLLE